MVSADREEAQVEARYDSLARRADVRIESNGMSVAALGKQATLAGVPLLSQISAGQWSGELNYRAEPESEPVWTGNIALQDGVVAFPGFAAPVLVQSAQGRMDADGAMLERIHATAAGVPVEGDYEYLFGEDRPHRFHLRAAAVSGAEIRGIPDARASPPDPGSLGSRYVWAGARRSQNGSLLGTPRALCRSVN